jgi:hypothetical protein
MMKNKLFLAMFGFLACVNPPAEAVIKITSFENESNIPLSKLTEANQPYLELIAQGGFVIEKRAAIKSSDGKYKIIFEDAGKSGFHRPHWKFNVWIKSKEGFPFLEGNKILHSVFFYDGEGEMQVRLSPEGKLFITGGRDVLNPWKVATMGRGNPYHTISHDAEDDNGVTYFDNDGFVAYPYNRYSEESQKSPGPRRSGNYGGFSRY